ncbi:Xylanolytic transcriptional activator xlnR [Escovopsis weberi]|uniref:Xylanolytic transcriptional activator xlnR n=1 Tax=Escovopsis weberi TaxID=150374 RepID=A0A0M8MVM4_ESCWE|nr:Xylanolytic transcriptional activator xlnR [Escovopsis weberi]
MNYENAPSEPYYSVYNSNVSKKKNTRASQACDSCRQLKAKCDELKPCKTCRDKGTECRYRDPVPKAISTDKAQADILEGIQNIQSILGSLSHQFERMDERVSRLEADSRQNGSAPSVKRAYSYDDDDDYKHASPLPIERHLPRDDNGIHDRPIIPNEPISVSMMVDDEIEAEPGPPVAPGEPAIPINHTTLAGLLLDWDPIKVLTRTHLEQAGVRYISEYPIGIEQVRGLLKVYGRGEDSKTARQPINGGDHGSVDMADDVSDIASSSPAADWGQLGSLSPGDNFVYQGGILGFDGNPDFTDAKVWTYVDSFKTNILNLHPIIQPHVLDEWVRQFLDSLPIITQKSAKPMSSKSAFAVASYADPATNKRKRSPAPDGNGAPANSVSISMRAGRPSRSIHSALVLLIVALGKICLHRENVPDVVHNPDPPAAPPNGSQESPAMRNGVPPSPIQGSPPGLAQSQPQPQHHTSGLPSPKEHERGSQSRRSSIHGAGSVRIGYSPKKNYEVIPGLEYFALATDILGNHHGAYHNIKNVYANIFAGLYHGQLARPLESFSFIHKAGHTLQVIMRPSLDRLHKIKQNTESPADTKSNDITLAFWTCLQLESDLIAELPLPPSGLLQYEDDMPNPNMRLLEGFEQRVLDSYLGQLYLRKHLNSIHRLFYSPDDKNRVESEEFKTKVKNVDIVSLGVSDMSWVPQSFAFHEEDGPASDILAARLRAKYWGAQVITYRPFVRQILQWSFEKEFHPGRPSIIWSGLRDGIAPNIPTSTTATSDLPPAIVELAEKGIKALIESTRAFHGLGQTRPIITNVFGTAHAQWGNMLVLTAAFKDPILNQFVNKALLRGLFEKTLYFFRQSATTTSSLKIDMLILEGLYKDLFFGIPESGANLVFSGNGGAQTPKQSMAAPPPLPYMANDVVMTQPSYSMPPAGHPQGH